MIRTLIAATLSVALALPLATAPARADIDGDDVAKVLGGLALLYVLSETLQNDNRRSTPTRRAPAPVYLPPRPRQHDDRVRDRREGNWHRDDRRRHRDVRILPEQCYVTHRTRQGRVSGYSARCMQNAVARPGLLPPQCIRQLRTDRGPRNIYGPRCLRRDGWSPRTATR